MLARRDDAQMRGVQDMGDGSTMPVADFRPPELRVGQAQSRNITPGKIQRSDTLEEYDEVMVVPILVRSNRLKWAPGDFDRERLPECWSDDGVSGSQRSLGSAAALYPGQLCATCDYYTAQPWIDKAKDGWCTAGWNALVVDAESFTTYLLRLKGTAYKVGRALMALRFRHVVRLRVQHMQEAGGDWYQLQATPVRRLDAADESLVRNQLADYAPSAQAAVETDSEGATTETPEPVLPGPKGKSPVVEVPTPAQRAALPEDHRPIVKTVVVPPLRSEAKRFTGVTPEMDLPF